MEEITRELAEYVADVDVEMARRAIRAIGRVAMRLPKSADPVCEKLIELLDLEARVFPFVRDGATKPTRTDRVCAR